MKPIRKDVTINDYNKRAVAFAENLDFTELFEYVQKFLGVECTFLQPKIYSKRRQVSIAFKSGDITTQTGLLSAVLNRCHIYSFTGGVDADKKTGELQYWVLVNIRYEHKSGSKNSLGVLRAWYCNGEWGFLEVGS